VGKLTGLLVRAYGLSYLRVVRRAEREETGMREDIEFDAEGATLRGWFYRPDDAGGAVPCVVMAHGFSAIKEMRLDE